jgi:hypothetical protein
MLTIIRETVECLSAYAEHPGHEAVWCVGLQFTYLSTTAFSYNPLISQTTLSEEV